MHCLSPPIIAVKVLSVDEEDLSEVAWHLIISITKPMTMSSRL